MSTDGILAVYSCASGYSLNGSASRSCASDGSGWYGTDPFCGMYLNAVILHLIINTPSFYYLLVNY